MVSKAIFMISTGDAKKQRREELTRFLEPLHWGPVQHWEAASPADLHGFYIHYLNSYCRSLTYAHTQLWRHMLDHNMDYILVLEDNVRLSKNLIPRVSEFLSNLPQFDSLWDAVFLNVSESVSPPYVWMQAMDQCMSGAYVLSRRGAEFLCETFPSTTQLFMADWMTQMLQRRKHSYTYFPWLAVMDLQLPTTFPRFTKENEELIMEKVHRLLKGADLSIEAYH